MKQRWNWGIRGKPIESVCHFFDSIAPFPLSPCARRRFDGPHDVNGLVGRDLPDSERDGRAMRQLGEMVVECSGIMKNIRFSLMGD